MASGGGRHIFLCPLEGTADFLESSPHSFQEAFSASRFRCTCFDAAPLQCSLPMSLHLLASFRPLQDGADLELVVKTSMASLSRQNAALLGEHSVNSFAKLNVRFIFLRHWRCDVGFADFDQRS